MFKRLLESSQAFRKSIWDMWNRFPIISVLTVVGTVCAYMIVANDYSTGNIDVFEKIIMLIALGVPYLVTATLICEQQDLGRVRSLLIQIVGVLLLAIYYLFLPTAFSDIGFIHGARVALSTLIGYILLFSVPLYKRTSNDLWVYGGSIVRRAALAILFTITVWVGLVLAIMATHYLFELSWNLELLFSKIWIIDVGIIGTWIILGGFPKVNQLPENILQLTRALRWLLQFVLVPLVSIFFLILYAYLIMIVATWNWPKGGVAQWILGFSFVGMVLFIVSFTLSQTDEYKWLRTFFKLFFALLIPMTVVLFMAVGIRIQAYGLTEQRYMIVVGGVWLLCTAVYYLFTKTKALHAIPYSVALVFIVATGAPIINMFSLSAHSQATRLKTILESNNMMVRGFVVTSTSTPQTLTFENKNDINSILEYLTNREELSVIAPWFKNIDTSASEWSQQAEMANQLGVSYYNSNSNVGKNSTYFSYSQPYKDIVEVAGYDSILNNLNIYPGDLRRAVTMSNGSVITMIFENQKLLITPSNEKETLVFDMNAKAKELFAVYKEQGAVTPEEMNMVVENPRWRVKFAVRAISGFIQEKDTSISSISGILLFKKK